MAQSQTGDVDLNRGDLNHGANDAAATAAVLSDRAVSFRFVVTLKCLSIPLDSGQTATEAPQAIVPSERARPTPVPVAPFAAPSPPAISVVVSAPAVAPPVVPEPSRPAAPPDAPAVDIASPAPGLPWELAAPAFRLETVVPTVLHAFKKPATEDVPDGTPCPAPETPAATVPPMVATVESATERPSVPNLYTAPSRIRKSLIWKLGAGALAAVAILIPVWRQMTRPAAHPDQHARTSGQSTPNGAPASIQSGDWIRQASVGGDPGFQQARQLVLYKPGLKATDGRIEFAWSTNSGDVGVVFRAKNLGNYYAVRLKLLNPRTTPTLDVEYFSVVRFEESRHQEKFLMLSKVDPALLVRIDVFGPTFTLYLQDNAVEYWTDVKLTAGGMGFFEEWNRAPQVNAVRISFGQRSEFFGKPLGDAPEFLTRKEPSVLARRESRALGGS